MNDKFKDFWIEKSKEEIINAYRECIHNGEVLFARIDKAIEYIEEYNSNNMEYNTQTLLDILKGSDSNDNIYNK